MARWARRMLMGVALGGALGLGACADRAERPQLDVSVLEQSAASAERERDYAAAAGQYRNLMARQPKRLDYVLGLARNLRYLGLADDALKLLAQAEEPFEGDPEYLVEWGKVLIAAGRPGQAVVKLEQAIDGDDGDWQAYSALGIARDLGGDFAAAREAYAKALTLSAGNPVVLNNLAMSRAQSGDLDQAIAILEGLHGDPRSRVQFRQNLALLYAVRGDTEKAKALAKHDLDDKQLERNLSYFQRFERPPIPAGVQ